jgi:hypothetical protein
MAFTALELLQSQIPNGPPPGAPFAYTQYGNLALMQLAA